MARGRRQTSVAPAPVRRWWGSPAVFVADELRRLEGESDPVSRATRAESQVANAVADALISRDYEGARSLVSSWRDATPEFQWELAAGGAPAEDPERFADRGLEEQARLLAADRELGRPNSIDALRRFGRVQPSRELALLAVDRLTGDAGERAAAEVWDLRQSAAATVARDFTEWQTAARAILRVPGRYAAEPGAVKGREVVVTADEAVAHEVFDHAREAGWATDLRLMVAQAPGRQGGRDLSAYLRAAASVEGVPFAVSVRIPLARTAATSEQTLVREARRHLQLLGWDRGVRPEIDRRAGKAILQLERDGLPDGAAATMIGHDVCRHPDAYWDDGIAEDGVALRCGACLRQRIAIIPAHRLPATHAVAVRAAAREREYLRRERARALIAGAAAPEVESIGELRERDGLAPLDPADYRQPVSRPRRAQSLRRALGAR